LRGCSADAAYVYYVYTCIHIHRTTFVYVHTSIAVQQRLSLGATGCVHRFRIIEIIWPQQSMRGLPLSLVILILSCFAVCCGVSHCVTVLSSRNTHSVTRLPNVSVPASAKTHALSCVCARAVETIREGAQKRL